MSNRKLYHPLRRVLTTHRPHTQGPKDHDLYVVASSQFTFPNWALESFLKRIDRTETEFNDFKASLVGTLVTPFDAGYEKSRMDSDPAFNKYPYMVAYCNGLADVQKCLQFTAVGPNRAAIKIIPRGGGHSTEAYSVMQEGLVIDLSSMQGVIVDNTSANAFESPYVICEAGVLWAKAYQEVQAYDLHVVGGDCDNVGVAGFTMGGGYSKTSMRFGMGCDNILQVKMVTVNGDIVIANAHQNSDLYWGVRGGTGGQFGIVVSFWLKCYPILPKVYKIAIDWPIDEAAAVLHAWQENLTKTNPEQNWDLGILGFLYFKALGRQDAPMPKEKSKPMFTIRGVWLSDDVEAGKKALAPLLAAGPHYVTPAGPLFSEQTKQPYPYLSTHLLDDVEGVVPDVAKETKRCAYVEKKLTIADYQGMVNYFITSPCEYNIVSMEPYGGAISARKTDDNAFVHRNAYFDIFVDSFWVQDDDQKSATEWLDNYYEGDATRSLWSNHYYQNYVYAGYADWAKGYFDSNLPRLSELKKKYDPNCVLSYDQSIPQPMKKTEQQKIEHHTISTPHSIEVVAKVKHFEPIKKVNKAKHDSAYARPDLNRSAHLHNNTTTV